MSRLSETEYEVLKEKFRAFLKQECPDFEYIILIYDEKGMYCFGLGDPNNAKFACVNFLKRDEPTRIELDSMPKGSMN